MLWTPSATDVVPSNPFQCVVGCVGLQVSGRVWAGQPKKKPRKPQGLTGLPVLRRGLKGRCSNQLS